MSATGSTLSLTTPGDFDLPRAVCSYGYFMLAPNFWDAAKKAFHRPLHGHRDRIIQTVTTQPGRGSLRVRCDRRVTREEGELIRAAIRRMLRVDDDMSLWHAVNTKAKRAGFGRLFRSPSFYEDVVKTMTGCNVTWPNTMRMNGLLCEHIGKGAFPTPAQLAAVKPEALKARCKVGYRAERIVRFARSIVTADIDPAWFEHDDRTTDELFTALRGIYGLGPYAASNMCQCLGRYDRLAIDSETYRHFTQVHGMKRPKNPLKMHKRIERHYAKYRPYQFLAYWFELWGAYEDRFGDARRWDANEHGPNFTAAVLR